MAVTLTTGPGPREVSKQPQASVCSQQHCPQICSDPRWTSGGTECLADKGSLAISGRRSSAVGSFEVCPQTDPSDRGAAFPQEGSSLLLSQPLEVPRISKQGTLFLPSASV